ncbi:unnamed protein product [Fusarium equiseti]|uniref:Uncharacterized protein n=1 Tax=Fusarium equiseti TaxID=61235 RepID=A0A8J2N9U5_FUSEQ|nr:unnamed protein product [Fusarium equiseti]
MGRRVKENKETKIRAVRNGTTIRFAVQANPDQAPLNVELLIVTHPETGGPAIQLRTLASRFADENQELQQDEEDEEQDQDQDSYETHPVPRHHSSTFVRRDLAGIPLVALPTGMRPPGGHSHLEPDEDDDDVPWSDYKPWVSTSNGSYVGESPFLDDFFTVLGSALRSLRDVSNHGPDTFLFSSGSSTQVRWSTSADEFAPPHDSLPTFSVDDTDSHNPGSTVTGIGDQPTPTARPANVWDIYNVDPGLTKDLKRLQEDDINRGCLDGRAETVTLARDASIPESVEEEMPVVTKILSVAPQEHIYNILGRVREREQQWIQDDSSKPQSTTIRCVPTPPINGFTSINCTRHVTSSST